jgi:hypothetical protein
MVAAESHTACMHGYTNGAHIERQHPKLKQKKNILLFGSYKLFCSQPYLIKYVFKFKIPDSVLCVYVCVRARGLFDNAVTSSD